MLIIKVHLSLQLFFLAECCLSGIGSGFQTITLRDRLLDPDRPVKRGSGSKNHRLPFHGMNNTDRISMQGNRPFRKRLFRSISKIANDWKSRISQLDPDLMVSSAFQIHLQEGHPLFAGNPGVGKNRLLSILCPGNHAGRTLSENTIL